MPGAPPLFRVPSDADLPPLAGARNDAVNLLERLLEALIDAAGANRLPAPAQSPDGPDLGDAVAALETASARFQVAPGIGLADHFWTHCAPYRNGAVGARLIDTARGGLPVQGFLALYATDVRPPLLYRPNMPPLRVRETISVVADVGAPYLALIACEGTADGRAEAISGHAMPIYSARRFMPVRSALDRDVLGALEHLQVVLDAHGVECAIQRIRPRGTPAMTSLMVTLTPPGGMPRHFRIAIDPSGTSQPAPANDKAVDFTVTHRNWADGSFIRWFEQAVTT